MGAYVPVKVQTQGASAPIIINLNANAYWQAPPSYSLGIVCTVSPGATLSYSVQITADPNPSSNSSNWNNHDTLVSLTTSANGNIAFPVTGVRLNVSSYVSGSVNLGIAQWP
jgi:hypothetical protein